MPRSPSWLVLLFVAFLLVGCAKPEDKYVGHFNGKITIDPDTRAKLIQEGGDQAAKMVQAMESAAISLDLNKDKTYKMQIGGPMGTATTGTWTFADGVISCAVTNGKNPTRMTPSEDGNTLTAVNTKDGKSEIVFTRGPVKDPAVQ